MKLKMKPIDSCFSTNCCEASRNEELPIYSDLDEDCPWILELTDSPAGKIRKVKTQLELQDTLGSIRVRLGIKRDNYKISPGLYAVGNPDHKAHVLVTANYKLTFDSLRKELAGQNLWILVLDTRGINVWCAAGKGTFGTQELILRITLVQLHKIISHKTIILPQLGAPGVNAHEITKNTGFKVVYGPVRAADIPRFLNNNLKAAKEMRKVKFTLKDRLMVIPVELKTALKLFPIFFALLFIFNMVNPGELKITASFVQSLFNFIPYVASVALGTIGIAVLLPYIPFRSFAVKGLLLGMVLSAIVIKYHSTFYFPDSSLIAVANILFLTSITSFLSLNFTGSTTYTSLSGVQKETIIAIPVIILASIIGLVLVITHKIMLFTG